ncbi:PilZ domain-containing protein [Oceanisphaera psychrotolerans]|uniref:Cyclic diguanosine monophosphate-binding protein n=1 Tax=Oceanisphaera psychrotolerans TaxID=1414654 RepID=A0A1J4QJP0_9GAMM|nr:PilZ domain-containing protein [Oceanisphaera psychrotolerans]OIN13491.1 hypothetical protein BFR47_10040 [Oceanisphaera psychrotolerans]
MAERRLFARIGFEAGAWLIDASGHHYPTRVHDLSLHGALTTVNDNWPGQDGDEYELQLSLDGHGQRIIMKARQRYHRDGYIGLECLQLDIDSAGHLRRLIELNLADESLLQRQLAQLVTED